MAEPQNRLTAARFIDDLSHVSYPEHIKGPRIELNFNARAGKFRYDRDFLLQFMDVCKDKPDSLPPLETFLAAAPSPTIRKTFVCCRPGSPGPKMPLLVSKKYIRPSFSQALTATIIEIQSLLNGLTPERFDVVSERIITLVNLSEGEEDALTLTEAIRLVVEKSISEVTSSQLCARLCRTVMERVSPSVVHKDIHDGEGQFISGGRLFRKLLLNRCQEEFERLWTARAEATVVAAASTTDFDNVPRSDMTGDHEQARRHFLGVVSVIGELFKLQMLTERPMHECIKKLLANTSDSGEDEIKSVCTLLETCGHALDTTKARNHMDIYFRRMKDLSNSEKLDSRLRFMLLDIIELRSRNWVPRGDITAPNNIAPLEKPVISGIGT